MRSIREFLPTVKQLLPITRVQLMSTRVYATPSETHETVSEKIGIISMVDTRGNGAWFGQLVSLQFGPVEMEDFTWMGVEEPRRQ